MAYQISQASNCDACIDSLELGDRAAMVMDARARLKRAMRRRRTSELQAAIKCGELMDVYPVELEHARRALDMERKANARARIKEAERSQDVGRWYAAIGEAKHAGLSPSHLQDTMRALAAEEVKVAARASLKQAMRASNREEVLRLALANAEVARVDFKELEVGRAILAQEQECSSARLALRQACLSRDTLALRSSIALAVSLGLGGHDEAVAADHILGEEKQKADARIRLKDAGLGKVLGLEAQTQELRAAVQAGETAGLSASEMAPWCKLLNSGERRLSAVAALEKAQHTQSLEALTAALEQGEAAGLDAADLAEARRLQNEALKPDARERLRKAIASRSIEQLSQAINHGEKVGLTKIALEMARSTLLAEEHKVKARANLHDAEPTRDVGRMSSALRYGEAVGLEESELDSIRRALADEQRKAAARKDVSAAVKGGTTDLLRAALSEGSAADLTRAEMKPVRSALLLALEQAAQKSALGALKSQHIAELHAAVSFVRECGTEIDGLLVIIGGSRDPATTELLDEVQRTLAAEERKVLARRTLAEAEQSRELADLRSAVSEGAEAGLSFLDLRVARALLADEEVRVPVLEALREAVLSADAERLRQAIRQGERARLSVSELRAARDALALEERRTAAASRMLKAESSRSVSDLHAALKEGEAAGVDVQKLRRCQSALHEEMRRGARSALVDAEHARSVGGLRAAIAQGEVARLPAAELSTSRSVLVEARLREATRGRAANSLASAIKAAQRDAPGCELLHEASEVLEFARRQEAARTALGVAEKGSDVGQLLSALKQGRSARLEDWELAAATAALNDIRRVMASTERGSRSIWSATPLIAARKKKKKMFRKGSQIVE